MSDEMTFEDLLASPYLQFDLDGEVTPHLVAFGPTEQRSRPWLYDTATGTTITVEAAGGEGRQWVR
jgi:hypothetical protein